MKLIHLTDTHLVRPGDTLYDLDPQARLRACVADINNHHADAEACVITGDLAHWGENVAYVALKEALAPLLPPCILLLGNHDNREEFLKVFPRTPVDTNGFVQDVVDLKAGRFLFLDTNQPKTHAGWYCEQRLEWLRRALAEAGNQPIFMFMHHPPFPVHLEPLDRIGLKQADAFHHVVAPHANQIRHLFFGHVHRPIAGSWLGIPFTTLRATSHQTWLDFTATGDIPGSHEPPAYAIVLIEPNQVVVHFHDFLDASPKFAMGGTNWESWAKLPAKETVSA